ncbi:DEKNAAC103434 [Brettanomyces naardenensis]|uniref:DEKNAAC103434 n=1 Tax=Brettanomyces naardenensis TaxID=13370 RepID=A0A448YNJ4_BRENA|nr:DEKNAAC103434 [Brettanomyces naardenensis]
MSSSSFAAKLQQSQAFFGEEPIKPVPSLSRTSTPSTASLGEVIKKDSDAEDKPEKDEPVDSNGAYVIVDISGTGSEQSQYTTKDASEIIEIAWTILDSKTLTLIDADHKLVKPINTPISPLCSSLTGLTWSSVKDAGTLNDAISSFDESIQKHLVSEKRPFSFVTFNSWDLRMKLAKEAREKSIQLRQYLKYPRYFDLRREFARYEENMKSEFYSSNSINDIELNQVVDSLSIDVAEPKSTTEASLDQVAASTYSSSSTDLSDPASFTTKVPRTAEDTVEILIKILSKLLESSLLKRPHDMGLDLAQFYNERSRVLYITNLPLDVTQGELESWFTQFGCRPIAFWTIKSPLPEFSGNSNLNNSNAVIMRSTCSGFVIFASHESAADSLAMNGRVLNDRIVEVQPSSVKVLDRAQEILTPFPSSKNRPRPGDWTCPSCGFSNFQRRTACFRCSFPAASAQAVQDSIYGGSNNGGYYNNSANGSANTSDFNASNNSVNAIGHHNQHHHNPHQNTHHNQYQNQGTGRTYNGNNSQYNNGNNGAPNLGSSNVPFRAGDWKCMNENCAYHNFAKNVCCLKCGAPRVQSAILTGHPHNPHHNGTNNTSSQRIGYQSQSYGKTGNGRSDQRSYGQPYGQSNYSQFVSQLSSATNTPTMQPMYSQGGSVGDANLESLSAQITNLSLNKSQGNWNDGNEQAFEGL